MIDYNLQRYYYYDRTLGVIKTSNSKLVLSIWLGMAFFKGHTISNILNTDMKE